MVNESASWRAHPQDARIYEWRAPDGMALRRLDWPRRKGKKRRGRLLFAGGRGDFIEKYLESYAHWRDAGWDVAAFDWRGQGGSQGEGAATAAGSFEPLIADFVALIEDWCAGGPGPYAAIGHSMGGHMLLRTLVEHRPPLDAAVLIAPMLEVNSAPFPARAAPDLADMMYWLGFGDWPMWKTPAAMLEPGGRRNRHLTTSPERYADELYWWGEAPAYNLGPPTWGWMRAAYRSARAFAPEKLARVALPILLLGTAKDRLVSAEAIRRAAAALPAGELEMLDDAAHEILREADPIRDRALARIDAFLKAHESGSGARSDDTGVRSP